MCPARSERRWGLRPLAALSRRSSRAARAAILALSCVLLFFPGSATADEAEAASFFSAGQAAFAKRDYKAAAVSFQAAYRAAAHPAASYNAGLAWALSGEPERAADAFSSALAGPAGLTAAQKKDARQRLAKLQATLATLDVDGPSDALVSVGHATDVHPPTRIHLAAGTYDVRVRAPSGASRTYHVELTAGATRPLSVEPPPAPTITAAATSEPPSGARPTEPPAAASPVRTIGWVSIGLSVIGGTVAIATGVAGLEARDAFERSGYTDAGARARAADLRIGANVAWVAAGVLAASGVVLVLVGGPDQKKTSVNLTPAGLSVQGQF
jgi:hypothetical protein